MIEHQDGNTLVQHDAVFTPYCTICRKQDPLAANLGCIVFRCVKCHSYCSAREAWNRAKHTGLCSCGGGLSLSQVPIELPEPQVIINDDPLMAEAFALTTGDRHSQYGTAEEAFAAYAQVWTGLLAHKLNAALDAADVAILMTGLKLTRDARNPKRDNVVDAHGYLSILARLRGWFVR